MILSIILNKLRKSNIKFIKFKSHKIVYFVQTYSKSSKILKKWILESYRIMHFSLKKILWWNAVADENYPVWIWSGQFSDCFYEKKEK